MNAQLYGAPNDEIIVRFEKRADDIAVHVTDHGIGITRDEASRVFDRFFRSDKAIVSSPDGSGLGLSLTKTLVEEWGGTISFTSEEGKGTTFTVTIPPAGMQPREGEVTLME